MAANQSALAEEVSPSGLLKTMSELEFGRQRDGYAYSMDEVESDVECLDKCDKETRCEAMSFYIGENGGSGVCRLQSAINSAVAKAGVTSAYKRRQFK
ncbi:MAG: hypothetical protein F6K16_29640 [Symploca sp. SIO2B6]|nr:hypothetical protein [Symploca sp. SIO2B6]